MRFWKFVLIQNKKASKSVGNKIAQLLLTLFASGSFLLDSKSLLGVHYTKVMPASRMWSLNNIVENSFDFTYGIYLMFGIPIISVLFFSNEIVSMKAVHISQFIFTRMKRSSYYVATALVTFVRSAFFTGISLVINQLMWIVCCPFKNDYPLSSFVNIDFEGADNLIFLNLFFDNPYLYNAVYILLISLFSGAIALFGLSLSFLLKKQIQIITIPLIVFLLENFLVAALGCYRYSIIETLSPMPLVKNLSFLTYVVFFSLLIVCSLILFFFGIFIKRDEFE